MQNRTILLAFIVLVSILIGMALAFHQINAPVLNRLVAQQNEILSVQKQLPTKMGTAPAASGSACSGSGAVSGSDVGLVRKIMDLEKKIDLMGAAVRRGGAQARRPAVPKEDFTKVYNIPIGKSTVIGDKNAPVTVDAFIDFECPFSAKFYPDIAKLLKAYPKKVNLVIKQFPLPFHPQARPAAKAVLAAGEQGKYFEMADAILRDNKGLSAEKLEALAQKIGLDVAQFKKDLAQNDEKYEKIIQEDMVVVKDVGVRGTPTFYIGKRMIRARSFDAYKDLVDGILSGKYKAKPAEAK